MATTRKYAATATSATSQNMNPASTRRDAGRSESDAGASGTGTLAPPLRRHARMAQRLEGEVIGGVRRDQPVAQQAIDDDEARIRGHDVGHFVVGDETRRFVERNAAPVDDFVVFARGNEVRR